MYADYTTVRPWVLAKLGWECLRTGDAANVILRAGRRCIFEGNCFNRDYEKGRNTLTREYLKVIRDVEFRTYDTLRFEQDHVVVDGCRYDCKYCVFALGYDRKRTISCDGDRVIDFYDFILRVVHCLSYPVEYAVAAALVQRKILLGASFDRDRAEAGVRRHVQPRNLCRVFLNRPVRLA